MAEKIISGLESIVSLNGDELLPVENGVGTYSASVDDIKEYVLDQGATTTQKGVSGIYKPVIVSINATDSEHDVDFDAGTMNFSDGSGQAFMTALTKRADATWAAGNNAGGMASGESLPASGTIHCFKLSSADGATKDFGFDTDVDATNLLADSAVVSAGLTKYERVCSLMTNSSSNFIPVNLYFDRIGGYFCGFKTPILDHDVTATTTPTNYTLSSPLGINCRVRLNMPSPSGSNSVYVYCPDDNDININSNYNQSPRYVGLNAGESEALIMTNKSSQVRVRSTGSRSIALWNLGFEDRLL